jgi:hypothetical protein
MSTFFIPPSDTSQPFVRPSSVLPAAGAYDPSPTIIPCEGQTELVFMLTYLRAAVGGSVSFKVEFSDDKVTWFQTSHLGAPTFTAAVDSVFGLQRAEVKYTSTSASQENFMSPSFTVAARWARISCKESGVIGSAGTVSVRLQQRGSY